MKSKVWPLGVALVLALTVGLNLWVYRLASAPDAAVVEPDYYRKAVAYDTTLAERRASDALGWRLDAALGLPDATGAAPLTVRLAGPDGAPLDGARVRVRAVHNLIAGHAVEGALAPAGAGVYAASLPLRLRGLWELDFEIDRGGDRFTPTLRCDTGARAAR